MLQHESLLGKTPFLKTRWEHIVSINYIVPEEVLKPFLPSGMELDAFEGNHIISLVALHYSHTRVWNIPVPFHTRFAELSLRMYVKRLLADGTFRYGVTFPKLYFPIPTLTWIARSWYKEKYHTAPLYHTHTLHESEQMVHYRIQNSRWHDMEILSDTIAIPTDTHSLDAFTNKHLFGYARINNETITEYAVSRYSWGIHPVSDYKIDVHYEALFGKAFAFLDDYTPHSVSHSTGSEVHVFPKKIIQIG